MPCAGAGYITVILLGVMSSCAGEVGLVAMLVAKAASVGILVFGTL